jgi:hypothetical protein
LNEGTESSFSTTLPAGDAPSNNLTIRVKVVNSAGDIGTYEQNITVKPYIEKGLLSNKTNEMVETGNYTLAIGIASQIRNAPIEQIEGDVQEIENVISSLLNYTLSRIDAENMTQTLATQQLVVVEMLTTNKQIVSNENKLFSLNISLSLINVAEMNMSRTIVQESSLQRITNIISNIAVGGSYSDINISNQTILTSNRLAEFQLKQQLLGQIATSYVATNFKLSVMFNTIGSLLEKDVMTSPNSNNTVYIPEQFGMDMNESVISYTLMIFDQNVYQWDKNNRIVDITTPVLDLGFKDENYNRIPVSNLTEPILIHLKRNGSPCVNEKLECRYWSEEDLEWKVDGCILMDYNSTDNIITCACNHTTSFSAFILEKGDCGTQIGLDVTGIVFNSIYIMICLPILIGLFYLRNTQPLKSRFIAPYFGMISILVDGILQGWIRNSLSLADKYSASDAFSFIIMLTSNPLTIVTLFVFFWQHVRFILMQNIYDWMAQANGTVKKMIIRICRILSSKLIYCLAIITVILGVMFYFAILVGLAAHYSNVSIQDRNDMTATLSISMAIMMIILCTGIVLSLILDIILSIRKKSVIHQKLEEMEDDKQVQVIRKSRNIGFLVRYLKGNDPLYFRAETLLIVMTVIFTIVLYSVGIGSVMEQSTAMSPIVIVRTVIEIIMMFMEIVAFGGFVFAMTLNNYIRLKRSKYEIQENEQNNKNEDGLLEMIRNELGYQIVHQYCQMEFSLENLLLWKELEHLRSRNLVMTSDERKQTLQYINELYIKNNSERQLNIANKERKKFLKILEQDDLNGSDTEQALETLYDVCLANLSETAIRLRSSELYQDYLTIREAHQELKISF